MTPFRVAITQPVASPDPRRNGSDARTLMRAAAAEGARLILFPEGHLSGYAKAQVRDWGNVDWTSVRDELEQIARLAAELRLWTVLGSAHPLTPPNRPHNSMYVITDHGSLVDRYDKRFCSNTEITHYYTAGTHPTVFDVDGYRFGLATCIEINFPHLFTEYADLDIDCLLLPAYPVDAIFQTKAVALAAINAYWIAVCAVEQTRRLFASQLIAPDGTTVTAVDEAGSLCVGTLDRDDPTLETAMNGARPWRKRAREGAIYNHHHPIDDPRSVIRTVF